MSQSSLHSHLNPSPELTSHILFTDLYSTHTYLFSHSERDDGSYGPPTRVPQLKRSLYTRVSLLLCYIIYVLMYMRNVEF